LGRLGRRFFEGNTPSVAKSLLGCVLVRVVEGQKLSGVIVETEAYRGRRDPASHAYRGRTRRNEVMFGPPGHAYIYFTYGFHHMLNFTTESEGTPAAVLVRAIQPAEGIAAMEANRGAQHGTSLTDGPGKLTKALAIDGSLNGEDLTRSKRLWVEEGGHLRAVGTSTRIGVVGGASYKWRFFVKGSPFVSKGKPSSPKP
jgi:DNA-3-methyladenine glycosylase